MTLRRLALAFAVADIGRQIVRAAYRRGVLDAHNARSLDKC